MIKIDKTFNKVCFHCKSNITLKRHNNDDLIFYDNHFYHKQCFIDLIKLNSILSFTRKCPCCGKHIIISSVDEDVILYDRKYYHYNCFISKCNESKNKRSKWNIALNYLDTYKKDTKENIETILNSHKLNIEDIDKYIYETKKYINQIFYESDVNDFIRINYNPTKIPWNVLCKIYQGTYKNLTKPIPPEDLLDMWNQKIEMLNKIADKNKRMGNEIKGDGRILYDLAILVNKYDSYLNWKEQQKIALAEQDAPKDQQNIIYKNVANTTKTKKPEGDLNINDILDEI